MPRRRKKKSDEINTNAWMDTYADTITLLLTFFILLYSISVVDSQKLNELSKALQSSLNGNTDIKEVENIEDLKVEVEPLSDELSDYEKLSEELNKIINSNGLTDVIKIREEEKGIVLQLDESILFDSGKAELKQDSSRVLEAITVLLRNAENDVLIEGNTDNVPITNGKYPTNWELSTARAVSVARYFIETQGLNPHKISVKGYGEYNPLTDNNTLENKALNRRVDILILENKETK